MTDTASLNPKLVVRGADDAIAFYQEAFGAELHERYTVGDAVVYASLTVFGSLVSIKDEDDVDRSPLSLGAPGVLLEVTTPDPDAVGAALERAGASVMFPVKDQPYGARGGRFRDPFGHQWLVQTPLELEPDQVQDRVEDAYG